jgi:cyclic dehypoxanthinyl futalosine synthase
MSYRMTREQALDFFLSSDLIGLGMEADAARRKIHPEDVVTYAPAGEVSSGSEADCGKATAESNAIRIEAGLQEDALRRIRDKCPSLQLLISLKEVLSFAKHSHLDVIEALARLRDAGLDSIADDGLVLKDHNGGLTVDEWLNVHLAAHNAGLKTTAAFNFGAGESFEQRLDFLDTVGSLQEKTSGLIALALQSHAPARELDAPTGVEYLKMIAISRLYLPGIEHIQASSTAQGLKVLQMALRFGADDAGSVPPKVTEEDLRRVIRDAGFRPAQRDLLYRMTVFN